MEVEIRPLEEQDALTSVRWRNDPEIWKLTGSRPDRQISVEDELAWIRKVMADPTSARFAIVADGVYVGNIYLTDIHDKQAEYHIFIGNKEYWGKGVAKKASQSIIEYAQEVLGLSQIFLEVNEENDAAVHLYKKLGFNALDGVHDGFKRMVLNINTEAK